jgi:hypothetical protein
MAQNDAVNIGLNSGFFPLEFFQSSLSGDDNCEAKVIRNCSCSISSNLKNTSRRGSILMALGTFSLVTGDVALSIGRVFRVFFGWFSG